MTGRAEDRRGFLLGKFMPPHAGHIFLCDFARNYVGALTILVCSLPDDPIPGRQRFNWMSELFPSCHVRWCPEVLPQSPEDDPEHFWDVWRDVVRRYHPERIDVVFASEAYGHRLAEEVGARFVPCDPARACRSCSGRAIRSNPFAYWEFIPPPVRPYFTRRVCMFGPESSGKSTLAGDLGRHFHTVVVPEYGRTYTDAFGTQVDAEDLRRIVDGHLATVRAAERQANRLVIEDTDPIMTAVWSEMLLGTRDRWFATFKDHADLYLLCSNDFGWRDDGTRYFPNDEDRRRFFRLCEDELKRRGVDHLILTGSREARLTQAIAAIERTVLLPPRNAVPKSEVQPAEGYEGF